MIIRGDSNAIPLADNSVDCVVTDPPYGLSFMGKDWDRVVPSVAIWREVLRVFKPGAFAAILCTPRQDCLSRMILNLEEAGFVTGFTSIYWTAATGFPKAANLEKLAQKRGADGSKLAGSYAGFQPKPSVEVCLVVMKPLSQPTYLDQALANGKGCSWLDDGRIPTQPNDAKAMERCNTEGSGRHRERGKFGPTGEVSNKCKPLDTTSGRFPANVLCSDDCLNDGRVSKSSPNDKSGKGLGYQGGNAQGTTGHHLDSGSYSRYFDLDAWFSERIKSLPESVQRVYPWLIVPKPSKREKNAGLDRAPVTVDDGRHTPIDNPFLRGETERVNSHPTVKPVQLMSYLITLFSREGDTVLDPFAGSGSSAVAAKIIRRAFVGVELMPDFADIGARREDHARPEVTQGGLFDQPTLDHEGQADADLDPWEQLRRMIDAE